MHVRAVVARAFVAATHRATEALPDRQSTSGLCLTGSRQFALQRLLPLLCRIGRPRCRQPAIEFALDQVGIFQQTDNLIPDDMVEQVLADRTIIAHWPAKMAPSVGTKASVVVDVACARAGRCARQRIAAFAARHQPLHDTGAIVRRGASACFRQQLLSPREGILSNDRRDRNLDPFRSEAAPGEHCRVRRPAAQAKRPCDALTRRSLSLAEASSAFIGWVA